MGHQRLIPSRKACEDVPMDSGKQLLMTMTGEMHQPVRLYYEVYDQAEVLKVFAKLRCVEFDREQKRWIWLYQHEAQPLKFATSYDAIPRQRRPIILGAFLLPHDDVMCLDVRSWERAAKVIVFFRSVSQTIRDTSDTCGNGESALCVP